jgi:hypothetical protein
MGLEFLFAKRLEFVLGALILFRLFLISFRCVLVSFMALWESFMPGPGRRDCRLDYPSIAKSAHCGRIRLPNTA